MENIVKERLLQFINSIGSTQKAFEKTINASQGYINNISKSIGFEKLNAIKLNYSQLNIEWLLTGAGEMLGGKRIGDSGEADKDKYIITLEKYNERLEHDIKSLEKRLAQYEGKDPIQKVG
ncbi:MAG: hypothetical protein IJ057_06560 [Bacteroidales bacterium]|nr:hypothetical protein [Bacteroidales bacterium]